MSLQELGEMSWLVQGGIVSLLLILACAVCYLVRQNTIAVRDQANANKELASVLTKMSMQLENFGRDLREIDRRLDNLESNNKCRDPTRFRGDTGRSDGPPGGP